MNVVSGILGALFALLHGGPALAGLRRPVAARGSHDAAALPIWARMLWILLALGTLAGSIAYIMAPTVAAGAIVGVGSVTIWLQAIANGFWIHGRPSLSHHLVRGALVAVILVLTVLGR